MPRLLRVLSGVAALGLFATLASAPRAQQSQPARPFNGLTTGVGDLPRLSKAKTRSIGPQNFIGEKGQGGRATTLEVQ